MINQIHIDNFRSIKGSTLPLRKINILYGPNGSGKSSVVYAPYVLRNFFVNPNQKKDSLFNLGFINLGGIVDVVNDRKFYPGIRVVITIDLTKLDLYPYKMPAIHPLISFELTLWDYTDAANIRIANGSIVDSTDLILPYTLTTKRELHINNSKLLWNGLTFETISNDRESQDIRNAFNKSFEVVKSMEIVSVKRGFFSPIFSTEQATEESIFALQIRDEGTNFESKIDYYFKQIFNKTFRFVAIPGSTSFYLKTQNSKGVNTDLVNEGFGVNQAVFMLIRLLKRNTSLAFIEEPEIHLHPSAQKKVVDVLVDIVQNEKKQIFLTTHSENIVTEFLSKIAKKELSVNDVQFYLATLENGETKILPQHVNDKGQIEGGLLPFMQAELDSLKSILGI